MESSFEQTLAEVWRQVLVENASVVELGGKRYPVRNSPRKGRTKWTSYSTETRFEDWSRIRRQNPVGRKWPGLPKK
jgi:hypothetical protein